MCLEIQYSPLIKNHTFKIFYLILNLYLIFLLGSVKSAFSSEKINLKSLTNLTFSSTSQLTSFIKFKKQLSGSTFRDISSDPKKRINPEFYPSKTFYDAINFWFNIYAIFDNHFVVLHDRNFHNLVYDAIDFSELFSSKIGNVTRSNLREQYISERQKEVKFILKNLALRPAKSLQEKNIISSIETAGLHIPTQKNQRKKFFDSLSKSVRPQTGLRNIIQKGFSDYHTYKHTVEHYMSLHQIPTEIVAISFVESSFNPKAHSRSNAVGTWQFMTRTAKHFMPLTPTLDYRKNVLVSTLSAIHLLKQNYKILQSWPLAITAYHSGTKQIINARRKLKVKNIKIDDFFKHHSHPTLGFASKNYYSEFVAMVFALAYHEKFFFINQNKPEIVTNYPKKIISLYVSKKEFSPTKYLKQYKTNSNFFKQCNLQFNLKRSYPAKTILCSDIPLPKEHFIEISKSHLIKVYPKNFSKIKVAR